MEGRTTTAPFAHLLFALVLCLGVGPAIGGGVAQLRIFPRPARLMGWAIVMLGGVVVVVNLVMEFSDLRLLPGGHSPLWLVAGVAGLLGGAMLIGSRYP